MTTKGEEAEVRTLLQKSNGFASDSARRANIRGPNNRAAPHAKFCKAIALAYSRTKKSIAGDSSGRLGEREAKFAGDPTLLVQKRRR